ncbi:nucleotidyltransferase domain-containing protein [Clostridium manihotivorum]|uniref:DNA polymerase III subunit beta n=1 Tax=Clostridium manihotivorum TaxID=2320868 RepID=A0A3R5U9S6_9CLOT|nr:nucleotidyltransferase domain-containing protein [Clostridium manihotivorum]QAA33042.1 DNA polymerase III subunit beta [Clostridium manihotivorum]
MDYKAIKALEEFVDKANTILNNTVVSAYCFGSAIYDDFHIGYSDLDFFIIVDKTITEDDFKKFSILRSEFKKLNHPYLSVLEGEVISLKAIQNDMESNVIYWGTSKDRLNKRYGLAGFSLKGLIHKGYLIFGKDLRNELPYPSDEEMLSQVNNMIDTIRKYAKTTDEDIHSMDWLFLISQSIYWLKSYNVTGKTNSAKWILDSCDYSWKSYLNKAVEIRLEPALAKLQENKRWLKGLGDVIQVACDTLVLERNLYIAKCNLQEL